MYEYELKLLGTEEKLRKTLERFKSKVPLKSSRTVEFATQYFDTPDRKFEACGFSLRYRCTENGYTQNVELKELSGGEEEGISKRIEITERNGSSFASLYFNLLARPEYPNDSAKPSPKNLEMIFETVVIRDEEMFAMHIDGRVIEIESAFDRIRYVKDGIVVGQDVELEFEIHNLKDIDDLKVFVDWFDRVVYEKCECEKFFGSKAQRARKFINLHGTSPS